MLTYLRRILESLDHPDMINLILHYLLALPDIVPSTSANPASSVSAARKRKSMDLATMMAARSDAAATPLLFNLVDLILACLRSHSHQTINATLQLISAILKRHHRYAVITLLHTEAVRSELSRRTVGAHQQEVEFLMSLASSIGGQDNFDEIYENVLRDTTVRLESHPCSLKLVAPRTSINNHKLPAIPDSLPGAPQDVNPHTLRPDDPVLNIILDRLETFFLNPVETNLSLTDTIFELAICGFMAIEGWFLRSPKGYIYDGDDGHDDQDVLAAPPAPDSPIYAEFQKAQNMKNCRRRPKWTSAALPRFAAILQLLADQVAAYRETIPRFDELLQQRREAFQTADSAWPQPTPRPRTQTTGTVGGTPVPEPPSSEGRRSPSPVRPSGIEGFAQRILSELGTPSRSGSPHGRKEIMRSSFDKSTPMPIPPKEFPINYTSPSRGAAPARSYSPGNGSSVPGSWDSKGDAVASQMKAFQAVDQSILARKVGTPSLAKNRPVDKIEPIPLKFDKAPVKIDKADLGDESGEGESEGGTPAPQAEEGNSGKENGKAAPPSEEDTISVSHALTNVILFQSFLFELASLVQVRAGLFDEVRFS